MLKRIVCCCLVAAAAVGGPTLAQTGTPAARKPTPGIVTGHVTCADTQRPARLAKVGLVAVSSPEPTGKAAEMEQELGRNAATEFVETGLDGAFKLINVPPGSYYLVVDQEGYLLPLAQFTRKELTATDEPTRLRVERALATVSVAADHTTEQDVRIERGGSVSGTATYDDGTPATGLPVEILSRDDAGKWQPGIAQRYRSGFGRVTTDARGHWEQTGLPAGEYVVKVDLRLNEYSTTTSSVPGHPDQTTVMRMQKTKYSLPLYSGNALRVSAAAPVTLGTGENRTGVDLAFPLSKLHRVTGQLQARDGHTVNAGTATVSNADDGSKVTDTKVDEADGLFHLEFVPEGEFQLKVTGAKDTRKVEVANPAGTTPRTRTETQTVRAYADAEQPLTVRGEVQGLVLTLADSKPEGKAAQP